MPFVKSSECIHSPETRAPLASETCKFAKYSHVWCALFFFASLHLASPRPKGMEIQCLMKYEMLRASWKIHKIILLVKFGSWEKGRSERDMKVHSQLSFFMFPSSHPVRSRLNFSLPLTISRGCHQDAQHQRWKDRAKKKKSELRKCQQVSVFLVLIEVEIGRRARKVLSRHAPSYFRNVSHVSQSLCRRMSNMSSPESSAISFTIICNVQSQRHSHTLTRHDITGSGSDENFHFPKRRKVDALMPAYHHAPLCPFHYLARARRPWRRN